MTITKIECKDCGKTTWNRTERCGPCRKEYNSMKDSNIMQIPRPQGTVPCISCKTIIAKPPAGLHICKKCMPKTDDKDVINWPKHYNMGKIQPIDAIEDWKLDFRLANAVKYIARCEHKGKTKQDLEKAIWYIERYIKIELDKEASNG